VEQVFSTADLHPRDRFDCWHSVVCKTLIEHDSVPESRPHFEAELHLATIADIKLVLFRNSPMSVMHTKRDAARANSDDLMVCRQIAGSLAVEQDGRTTTLVPGCVTLIDPQLPYGARFMSTSQILVLKVPRRDLKARIGIARPFLLSNIAPVGADENLISTYLAMLPSYASNLSTATEEVVKNQVLDLLAVSLNKAVAGQRPRSSCARSLAAANIRAAIEARLSDPALDATTAAGTAGVSVRYANTVLADEGTSVSRLILSMRLARCQRALQDPLQSGRGIADIAYGWGFSDMTHFGRSFRAAFGQTPSEFRKTMKMAQS
jgi:AraC family transcriptional activator of tynA and feaB